LYQVSPTKKENQHMTSQQKQTKQETPKKQAPELRITEDQRRTLSRAMGLLMHYMHERHSAEMQAKRMFSLAVEQCPEQQRLLGLTEADFVAGYVKAHMDWYEASLNSSPTLESVLKATKE